MNDLVARHGSQVQLFCTNRWEVKVVGDIWYKIFTDDQAIRGYVFKSYETMIYHPTKRQSKHDMAAMLAAIPYRVR